jgi:DNA-binding NarL/FixJ family response regulator
VPGDHHVRPVRVLIVEDDPRVRTALHRFLCASAGFDVVGAAATAAAALEMAGRLTPSVAVVDVFLPDARDGVGLLRVLTGELRIPAVAMSMHSGSRSGALAAGAYRFLDKDSAPELLLRALRAPVPVPGHGCEPGRDT